jgi:hypothetical protein
MPHFYFHLHNDVDAPDEEGQDFAGLDAARGYAALPIQHLAGETVKEKGRFVLSHWIDIEDEQRKVLDTVRFGDVIKVHP